MSRLRSLIRALPAALLLVLLAAPAAAQADEDCTYDDSTKVVSFEWDGARNLQALDPLIAVDTTFCADPISGTMATVNNTDTIEISGEVTGNPIGRFVTIDQEEGAFRPGATPETDGGESEIEIEFLDADQPTIEIIGVNDTGAGVNLDDHITLGEDGINLNADEAVGDVDVVGNTGGLGSYVDIDTGDGDDTISAQGGDGTGASRAFFSYVADGGDGEDTLVMPGGTFGGLAVPGPGDDTIDASASTSTGTVVSYSAATGGVTVDLSAQPGPQAVGGGEGTDTLIGLGGIYGSAHNDSLTGDGTANSIEGRGGSDTLIGGGETDFLNPGSGDDTVDAGPGDESIRLSPGNDEIDGGLGNDEVTSSGATGGVSVDLALGGDQVIGGGLGTDDLSGIEEVSGSDYGDTLKGTDDVNRIDGGSGGADTIVARGGDDTIIAPRSFGDEPPALDVNGGAGDDQIPGTENADVQKGGSGEDEIDVTEGDDTIDGGADTDLLDGPSSLSLTEGISIDLTESGPQVVGTEHGTDTISGIEDVDGTRQADTLIGDNGPNVLNGGFGDAADVLIGSGGDDELRSTTLNDIGVEIDGGPGADQISASSGPDEVDGGTGPDDITTWSGDDRIEAFDGEVDVINCGLGDADAVGGDLTDDVDNNCESFTEGSLGGGGGGGSDPACSDGLDNDGDGKTDFPADPGCTGAADTSEVDAIVVDEAACDRAKTAVKKAKKKLKKAKKQLKKAKNAGKRQKVKKAKKKVKKAKKQLKKKKRKKKKKC
ncbi:MAG TPA: calcium-binding protein [Solirubrobacterales bacterium]|nr:calcium-binding protein [Solirubrobacterales bacterium]